ncbi:disease resistance protein RPM1-like [Coffea eugenioides]|uniref:disease resistance protein RPM1-like n=1 Tax=Coffea eugenioides TaxID=49369 RepID=UPI000F609809|nr:disease resistance protein RPM1-like [Coffea eugenioides]
MASVGEISEGIEVAKSQYGTARQNGFSSSGQANADFDIRAQSLFIEEAQLLGFGKQQAEAHLKILDDHSQLKVVRLREWGDSFRGIIKNLIQQLYNEIRRPVPRRVESMDDNMLIEFVRDFLRERTYILVLDDVWRIDAWEAIKCVLPDCNTASRVVLTTRIADIASASCLGSLGFIYKMEPLSDKESWTLFCNRTFQCNDCPPNLEEVAKKILKKCEGLPLAIVAIGGVLALKDKEKTDEFEMILHGFGGEADGSGKLDRIKRVLLLSYNDLPHYLKSCLLYLSIYPEDYSILVDDILPKWIALGFVEEKIRITSTDIAMSYMKELINRSLIQVKSTSTDGTLDTCGLHDFVREILVSKSKEQDFTTVATKYYTRWPEKVRHLAIRNFTDNPQEFISLKCLRSVVIFGYEDPLTTTFLSKFLCGDPKLLKALDLYGTKLDSIPKQVFKLFHLRYLNLQGTGVKIIPKSIGQLQNLEAINLVGTNVTELPAEILKLRKLRSLLLGGWGDYSNEYAVWGCKCPLGIGKLICLEELCGIEADSDKIVREVGKLTQLRRLDITGLRREDGKELLSSLLRLTNLRELAISCIKEGETLDLQHSVSPKHEFLTHLTLNGRLERVPQWVTSLQSLRTLQLDNSRLREDENVISSLGLLPNLISLSLYRAYEGETLCFEVGGFQKLQRLELGQLTRLKWVRVEEESMPSLRIMRLGDCKLMQELPSGIQNLTRLESLGFYEMSNELMHKVQNLDKRSEDYQTISHIPQVFIGRWIDGQWEWTLL